MKSNARTGLGKERRKVNAFARVRVYIYKVWPVQGRRPPRGRAEGARLHTFLPLHGVGLVFFG